MIAPAVSNRSPKHSCGGRLRVCNRYAEERAVAKARLAAVLGDPQLRLPDIAAEVVRAGGGAPSEEATAQMALARILSPSDPAFKVGHSVICSMHCVAADVVSRIRCLSSRCVFIPSTSVKQAESLQSRVSERPVFHKLPKHNKQ